MRVNEEEIPGVSDASPLTIKQKKINSKRSLQELLNDVPPCTNYHPVHTHERPARSNLPSHVDASAPIELYDLFVTRAHRRLLAEHTNLRADLELRKLPKEERRRPWHDTNEWEIGVFLGLILLMSIDHSPSIKSYWHTSSTKPLYVTIQNAMSINRFQQIKRYFKMTNSNDEPDSYGPDWWKKLEPLATDIQQASQKYYVPGTHVSIDEQLILFKGRSKHTLKMVAKVAGEGFKIYSLCEANYLLAFLFSSKVSWVRRRERIFVEIIYFGDKFNDFTKLQDLALQSMLK